VVEVEGVGTARVAQGVGMAVLVGMVAGMAVTVVTEGAVLHA
jgi:hypothetical protein